MTVKYEVTQPKYSLEDYSKIFKYKSSWEGEIKIEFQSENMIIATVSSLGSRFDVVLCKYYKNDFCFTITNWKDNKGFGGTLTRTDGYSNYNDQQMRRGIYNNVDVLSATYALGKLMEIIGWEEED